MTLAVNHFDTSVVHDCILFLLVTVGHLLSSLLIPTPTGTTSLPPPCGAEPRG
jgi:hypothetical protein